MNKKITMERDVVVLRTKGPLVIGISGATCSGKTTLTKLLESTFPWATVIHQDTYFHPNDPQYHEYLPEIDCYNWELETALDLERMENDVKNLLRGKPIASNGTPFFENMDFVQLHKPLWNETDNIKNQFSDVPLIIIEGHIIFNRPFFNEICRQKFFLELNKDECYNRRQSRTYDPMPPSGFFEMCVWPCYEERLNAVHCLNGITFFDATNANNLLDIYQQIKISIINGMSMISNARNVAEITVV